MACTCWLYLLPTYLGCGIIFTVFSLFGYALWWLVLIDPARSFGVMTCPWNLMQYYDYFKYRLHFCLWVIFSLLKLMFGYMWTELSECLYRLYFWTYAIYLDTNYIELRPTIDQCQVVVAGLDLLLCRLSSLNRLPLGVAIVGSRGL